MIIAVGAAVRVIALSAEPLWVDEAFTWWMSRQFVAGIAAEAARFDAHPPLSYLLVKLFTGAGDSEVALRLPSVLAGVVTVVVSFLLGSRLAGPAAGAATAALVALSAPHVSYAREARMYAMLTAFVSVATYGMAALPAREDRERASRVRRRWPWILVVAGSAGALLTHNIAVVYVGALQAAAVLLWWTGRWGREDMRAWWRSQVVVLALWSWWAPAYFAQSRRTIDAFWIPAPNAAFIAQTMQQVFAPFGARGPAPTVVGVALAAALAVLGARSLRGRGAGLALGAAAFLPVAALVAASVVRPIFAARTILPAAVPFAALVGTGIAVLPSPRIRAAALVVLQIGPLLRVLRVENADWPQAAAILQREALPGDRIGYAVVLGEVAVAYYARPSGVPGDATGWPVRFDQPQSMAHPVRGDTMPRLLEQARGHDRVWLVLSHPRAADPDGLLLRGLSSLPGYRKSRTAEVRGVSLYRFDRIR